MPRADNFGDLMTADHKILSEGSESRNNHRYAVAVQDLATPWIQSHPCKTKTSQETQRSLQKFLEPTRKPKVKKKRTIPWNLAKPVKIFPRIIARRHHRSETNWIAEGVKRRVKEGRSAVLSQSGLGNEWWADSMECSLLCANHARSIV